MSDNPDNGFETPSTEVGEEGLVEEII